MSNKKVQTLKFISGKRKKQVTFEMKYNDKRNTTKFAFAQIQKRSMHKF